MLLGDGRRGRARSDQQEVPLVLAHHFAPLDAVEVASLSSRVVDLPDSSKDFANAAERTECSSIAKLCTAVGEHEPERCVSGCAGASDEERPGKAAVETVGAFWDVVHELGELCKEVADARRARLVSGHKCAEIDASGEAEDGGQVDAELLGPNGTCWGEACVYRRADGRLRGSNLGCEDLDVLAQKHVIETFRSLKVEACDF
jgi:hypothetical protein